MVEQIKPCSRVIKKHFNKKLVMTKEDDENFESSAKFWIWDNTFIKSDVKLRNIVTSLENIGVLHTEIVILTSV